MILTAYTDGETVNRVFSVGADDFVNKPLVGAELVTRIINRLDRVRLLSRLNAREATPSETTQDSATARSQPDPLIKDDRLFRLAADIVCVAGMDGYFKRLNPAFEKILGYTCEQLSARPLLDFVHPDDRAETAAELVRLQAGTLTIDFENRYRCNDGSYKWLSWHSVPVVEEGLVYAIARDITDRKQMEAGWRKSWDEIELRVAERTAELVSLNQQLQRELDIAKRLQEERDRVEAALRVSQARSAGILEIADDAIISIDSSQRITLFNQGAEKIFGYMAQDVLGQPLDMLLPLNAIAAHRQHVTQFEQSTGEARRMGERRTISGRRNDGTEFPAEASISRLNMGTERVFTVILRDISDRQNAQDALQQSEERLRLLIDGVEDYAIFMLDPNGYVASWNPGAERIKGYRAEEIIGQHFSRFYPQTDIQAGKPQTTLEQAERVGRCESDGWHLRVDGSRFYANTVITALRDGTGKLCGFTEITRDITQAKQRETERETVERMKDEFISVVSHELRTPLTSIHGSLGMLTSGLISADSVRGKRLLQIAVDSTNRLVRLINDILNLERIESGNVSMVRATHSVADLVATAVDEMQAIADHAEITLSVSVIHAEVKVDRDRIIQTLTNLLSNAIKFSPCGSTVWIKVERKIQAKTKRNQSS